MAKNQGAFGEGRVADVGACGVDGQARAARTPSPSFVVDIKGAGARDSDAGNSHERVGVAVVHAKTGNAVQDHSARKDNITRGVS